MMSSGVAPAWSAAARMKILMLEPVWLGANARLTSFLPATNPLPPTIARIAPVFTSTDVNAASMPRALSGSSLRASSASAWRAGSSVVWMRRPPRFSVTYRSW